MHKISKRIGESYKGKGFVRDSLEFKSSVTEELIILIACHPFSLMMDKQKYQSLKVPLVVISESRLNEDIKLSLGRKEVLNFGMKINQVFMNYETSCSVPSPLVVAYALGVIRRFIECYLAGFDGYESGYPRNEEEIFLLSI